MPCPCPVPCPPEPRTPSVLCNLTCRWLLCCLRHARVVGVMRLDPSQEFISWRLRALTLAPAVISGLRTQF